MVGRRILRFLAFIFALLLFLLAAGAHSTTAAPLRNPEDCLLPSAARAATYPPDVSCQAAFLDSGPAARSAGLSMLAETGVIYLPLALNEWSPLGAPPEEPPEEPPVEPPGETCDPSYPTVCIPPPPPDLDCGDIMQRNFQVIEPDSHGFDRDGDGIGCEE